MSEQDVQAGLRTWAGREMKQSERERERERERESEREREREKERADIYKYT